MAIDMCACDNNECSKRQSCYRYLIDATTFGQTYAKFEEKDCSHYIGVKPVEEEDHEIQEPT